MTSSSTVGTATTTCKADDTSGRHLCRTTATISWTALRLRQHRTPPAARQRQPVRRRRATTCSRAHRQRLHLRRRRRRHLDGGNGTTRSSGRTTVTTLFGGLASTRHGEHPARRTWEIDTLLTATTPTTTFGSDGSDTLTAATATTRCDGDGNDSPRGYWQRLGGQRDRTICCATTAGND